jgi:acetylornithine/N-succinyldiaminopimelate aminotransferase
MSNKNIIEKTDKYLMKTYGRYKIAVDSGDGAKALDADEKIYIDFGAGIGTNALGYADDGYVEAVTAQLKKVQHTCNYYYTDIQAEYSEKLCETAKMKRVFYGNSGAEANECAIKIARKYSFDKYGKEAERNVIITLRGSFHGRTITTLSATGQDVFHNYFFPFTEGFAFAEPNNIRDFEEKLTDKTCAVMLELIQGEGGVINLTKEYVKAIFDICRERDILLITDEIQTGMGRTGTFLASEQYGITPDIVTLAKGIAGGLPMGVCLVGDKCAETLKKSDHGTTFGGNPVCTAGAMYVIDKITEDGFLAEVAIKGEYFREKLRGVSENAENAENAENTKADEIAEISGLGLMIGIRFKSLKAADVAAKCHENGLLVLTAGDKLRFLPPLNISYEDIDKGLLILSDILKGINSK